MSTPSSSAKPTDQTEQRKVARELGIAKSTKYQARSSLLGLFTSDWARIEKSLARHKKLQQTLKDAESSIEIRVSNKRTLSAVLGSDVGASVYFEVKKRLKESNVAHKKIATTAMKKIMSTPGIGFVRV